MQNHDDIHYHAHQLHAGKAFKALASSAFRKGGCPSKNSTTWIPRLKNPGWNSYPDLMAFGLTTQRKNDA